MLPVVVAGLAAAGCGGASHAGAPSMPPADASPEDVVRAYVRAINAHDCTTARALAAGADAWCGHSTLDDLRITGTTDRTREGRPTEKVTQVLVEFTLHGGDASMGEGRHGWGYLLDRSGPRGAWRIHDQGVG